MEISWDAVNMAIIVGIPALIISLGAFFTAKVVTSRLGVQRQQIESYRLLFAARVEAAGTFTRLAAALDQACREGREEEVTRRNREFSAHTDSCLWLFPSEMIALCREYSRATDSFYWNGRLGDSDASNLLDARRKQLCESIAATMRGDGLYDQTSGKCTRLPEARHQALPTARV